MKEFKSDEEKIKFMLPIISRYRIFLAKYMGLNKTQIILILSRRLNLTEEECHLKYLTSLDRCNLIIRELKQIKYELTRF